MILWAVVVLLVGVDNPADLRPRIRPLPPPPPREEPLLKVRPDPSVLLPAEPVDTPSEDLDPAETIRRVEVALERDPALVQQHRGYLQYLGANPEMARSEVAWWELTQLRRFGSVVAEADETLANDPALRSLLDRFYDEMARDAALRTAVETLFHAELGQTTRGRRLSGAYDFLRANPSVAAQLLDNPKREGLLPETLRELSRHLTSEPELTESLRGAFTDLMAEPGAHTKAFPWWKAFAAYDVASPLADLSEQFHEYPHRFWIWHQRNLQLAEDVQARSWIRFWHRKLRREPVLRGAYADYLFVLREEPGVAKSAELRWSAALGEAGPWPPKVAPPRLDATAVPRPDEKDTTGPRMPRTPRPRRPSTVRPDLPGMPSMPQRPQRPQRPPRPERPDTPQGSSGAVVLPAGPSE